MKVALVIRDLEVGGAQRQVVALARGLHARGVPTCVISFFSGGPLAQDLRDAGVPLHALEKAGRWDVLRFLARLVGVLRRERPDVACSYLVLANILTGALKPLLGGARVAWGLRMSEMELERYDWLSRLTPRIERLLAPAADVVIANSEAGAREAVARGFRRARIAMVPNGIDADRFHGDAEASRRVREEWGVPPDAPLVGLVARLDPMKDHATFLLAARELAGRRPDARFACVGGGLGPPREALEQRARELGLADRLTWAVARKDMPAVYGAFTVMASSSAFGEGFPNAVAEAMACGTPCVVTNVGDSALVVGGEGTVVPPGDPAALAAGLDRAIESRRADATLSQRVRERVVREFGVERLVDRTLAALGVPE